MNTLLIFGAGNNAKKISKYINKVQNRILYYVDNDSDKWGRKIFGRKIIAPKTAVNLKYDYIVIASCYWKEIREQLLTLGVSRNKIRCPLAPMKMERFKKEYKEIYNIYGKAVFFYEKWYRTEQFHPDWMGMFINPYFFSRRKLHEDVAEFAHYMSGKCMDFGCGIQPYKKLLSVSNYVGVEIETEHKMEEVVYYDGHRLPFQDGEFDSIISSEVFEHVNNIEEIMVELNRVLKDGGTMLISAPFAYPRHCWPYDYRRYTINGIMNLLNSADFECIEWRISSSYWECIAQLKNVYWAEEAAVKTAMGRLIKKLVIIGNNLQGVLADKILPYSDKLYLDNVLVVKKKSKTVNG